jgi:hypothetical protein
VTSINIKPRVTDKRRMFEIIVRYAPLRAQTIDDFDP